MVEPGRVRGGERGKAMEIRIVRGRERKGQSRADVEKQRAKTTTGRKDVKKGIHTGKEKQRGKQEL